MEIGGSIKNYDANYNVDEEESFLGSGPKIVTLPLKIKHKNVKNQLLNALTQKQPPKDRHNIVLLILILHGVGILTPFNVFINAKKYFTEYKLVPNIGLDLNLTQFNSTENSDIFDPLLTEYRNEFLSYVGLATQLPNLIFHGINMFLHVEGNLSSRIAISIIVEIIILLITIILAAIDSSEWPLEFFYTTMVTVIIINIAKAIHQNCIHGIAGKFPMKYQNAVLLGNAFNGILTSLINILSITFSPDLKLASIFYFICALIIQLACFASYFILSSNEFYCYYHEKVHEHNPRKTGVGLYWFVFKKIWTQCLNIFMILFVTLSVFPTVLSSVEPIDQNIFGNQYITKKYFNEITCFLLLNSTSIFGNIIANFVKFPGPKYVWIFVTMRFAFIPFFIFCNYHVGIDQITGIPLRQLSVYFSNDYIFIGGAIVHGLSFGYFTSLCMMYAPKMVSPEYAKIAGMMAAFFLIFGLFMGTNFTFVLSWAVKQQWI